MSIDESMIGFKGRLSFLQYMPKKPTKWGMKAYVLADSKTGYTYSWRLYTGKMLVLLLLLFHSHTYLRISYRHGHHIDVHVHVYVQNNMFT